MTIQGIVYVLHKEEDQMKYNSKYITDSVNAAYAIEIA